MVEYYRRAGWTWTILSFGMKLSTHHITQLKYSRNQTRSQLLLLNTKFLISRKPKNCKNMAFYFTKFLSSRKIEEADLVLEYASEECLYMKYDILWNIFLMKKYWCWTDWLLGRLLYKFTFSILGARVYEIPDFPSSMDTHKANGIPCKNNCHYNQNCSE